MELIDQPGEMEGALESTPVGDFGHSQSCRRKQGNPLLGAQSPEIPARSEGGDTDKADDQRIPRATGEGMRRGQAISPGVVLLHVSKGT
jgi:hypothetical protein